jgi:two-component system cell cycle sensor histidine kinase/response regulator CckA
MTDTAPNTILVVDDHDFTRRLIVRLVKDLGYDTLEASNGTEAIALYGQHAERIVAATLDLVMPETNGKTTLAMLSNIAPFLPIVIASSLEPNSEHLQGRIPGTPGVTYLQKPLDQKALKGALRT